MIMSDTELDQRLKRIEQYTLLAAKNVLTTEEACLITGLSKPRMYALTSERKIPHYKQGKLYFKRQELEQWMTSHRVRTQADIDSSAELYTRTHNPIIE